LRLEGVDFDTDDDDDDDGDDDDDDDDDNDDDDVDDDDDACVSVLSLPPFVFPFLISAVALGDCIDDRSAAASCSV
jgi:hypothetical protein